MEKGKQLSDSDKMIEVTEGKKIHDHAVHAIHCASVIELEENNENFLQNIDLFWSFKNVKLLIFIY